MKLQNKNLIFFKVLPVAAVMNGLLLFLVAWVYPEVKAGVMTLAGTLLVLLCSIAYANQKALRAAAGTRSARYGVNAAVTTLLVVAIVVVLNFLNYNHFYKKDLTKTGSHTLSEQTVKLLKELKTDIKLTAYVKAQQREQVRSVVDSYKYYSSKIVVEYVDPDRDPGRTKAANIKKYGTVVVESDGKESRVDDLNEEKLTNALIKLAKNKSQTVCFLTGHGERALDSQESDGYASIKKDMDSSSWATRIVNLLEEGKVPETCSVMLILGPNKAFFDKEIVVLTEWLDNGGRALVAVDPNVQKGDDRNQQINKILNTWAVAVSHNVIVDPQSKLLGAEASVPIVATYSKEHVITKDFQAMSLFPLASSVELLKNPAAGLKVTSLAKSTPKSFAETDFKGLAGGRAQYDPGKDQQGPMDMMVAVEGKRPGSKSTNDTRLVVLGTSSLANNNYSRHAQNSDLFLNAVSWLADDESLISIRPKEEGGQAITLSQTEGRYIQLLSMVLVPLFTFGSGIVTYIRRRKL